MILKTTLNVKMMKQEIIKMLTTWNNTGIKYALLRNYEFLLDSSETGFDLDVVIGANDFVRVREILLQHDFVAYPRQFSLAHRGFGKYFTEEKRKFGVDLQIEGIHWNDMPYLTAAEVLPRRVRKGNLYVLSPEDAAVMYICHSLLGKRKFKEKYKQILKKLVSGKLDRKYILQHLALIFNMRMANMIIQRVEQGDFAFLERRALWYVCYYVFHQPRHLLTFSMIFLRWLKWLRLGKSHPLIAVIGPDGAGKSTAVEALVAVLHKNRRQAELVYMGRGKRNIMPIKLIAGVYKKYEVSHDAHVDIKKSSLLQKIVYTAAAPVYTADLLLRYLFHIFLQRKRRIIVTDRYCSDILVMEHVPLFVKKVLLSFFPKPALTFYLYHDAEVLYERRKQQSVAELQRQMVLYEYLAGKVKAVRIKTTSIAKDHSKIEQEVFGYLMKERY